MNTALRRTRNGISKTVILEGEAPPEVLEELCAGWAAIANSGWKAGPVFATDVFLTDEPPTGTPAAPGMAMTPDELLPYIRAMTALARD